MNKDHGLWPVSRPHIVIVGGGFGGLSAARALRTCLVDITLVDRRNFHLFQPLLYQVATGGLSPANIAAPLRGILRRQRNCRVLMGEVSAVDLKGRRVLLTDGAVPYDILIVAAGSRHSYFGRKQWESLAPGLKTVEDATEIRRRVLTAFEAAELTDDVAERRRWLNFVVVGAGPTGVELAGALAELSRRSLRDDFRQINPLDARVLLVEAGPRVLATYPPELSRAAERSLERLGVIVRTGTTVERISAGGVSLRAAELSEFVPARTVLWAAGVEASPLAKDLANGSGAALD